MKKDIDKKLQNENEVLNERNRHFFKQLLLHKKMCSQVLHRNVFIKEQEWKLFIAELDALYPDGFTQRLHTDFPSITNGFIKLCCLIKLHFNNQAIATRLGISSCSVSTNKLRLKKCMKCSCPDIWSVNSRLESFIEDY